MRRNLFFFIPALFCITASYAADTEYPADAVGTEEFVSLDEILYSSPKNTECATTIFANALSSTASSIDEHTASEDVIKSWIYRQFNAPDVLTAVLECPEIKEIAPTDHIRFQPIEYVFPSGRRVTINFETQPTILQNRINISQKRTVPDFNPSPRIGIGADMGKWLNTDPAWYGIMVVQAGALDKFVGPDKNNTISLNYIHDNIDTLYPTGYSCTSKSALANKSDMINRAVKNSVGIQGDTNDYYVAGDVNLQWLSYLEIGLDVVITVATFGGGTVIMGATKAARASRTLKNLGTSIRQLSRLDSVRDYIRASDAYSRAAKELQAIDRAKNRAAYTKKLKETKKLRDAVRKLESADDVKKYKDATKTFSDLNKYRHTLRGIRMARRGNVAARAWRAFRAAGTGGKELSKGARVARGGIKSGKIRDWLYQSTMAGAGALGKLERTGGLVYGALKFAGGMYDWTETSTGDYTSGLEFSPLLLLSADDLQGQENVVNHGMWLMWAGNSTNAADDDAAYLSAMDFAAKFHQDLNELQQSEQKFPCSVDIYVVRPIIHMPDDDIANARLYYLIMNDTPWTTKEG